MYLHRAALPVHSLALTIRPGAKVEVDGYATPGQVVLISETGRFCYANYIGPGGATEHRRTEARANGTGPHRLCFLNRKRLGASLRRADPARRTQGGFRLVPVTLLEEDQDHVVVSGAITDKDEVAVGGISALRGILLRLGAG